MSQASAPHAYEIKSASLPLVSFLLKTPDTSALQADMSRRLGATPGFFDNDPVVIDLSQLEDPHNLLDLPSVCLMLRTHQMLPVAVRGANEYQLASAHKAGLFEARDLSVQTPAAPRVETVVQEVIREVEVVREVPTGGSAMVIDKPLRSGQHVYAKGRDRFGQALPRFARGQRGGRHALPIANCQVAKRQLGGGNAWSFARLATLDANQAGASSVLGG